MSKYILGLEEQYTPKQQIEPTTSPQEVWHEFKGSFQPYAELLHKAGSHIIDQANLPLDQHSVGIEPPKVIRDLLPTDGAFPLPTTFHVDPEDKRELQVAQYMNPILKRTYDICFVLPKSSAVSNYNGPTIVTVRHAGLGHVGKGPYTKVMVNMPPYGYLPGAWADHNWSGRKPSNDKRLDRDEYQTARAIRARELPKFPFIDKSIIMTPSVGRSTTEKATQMSQMYRELVDHTLPGNSIQLGEDTFIDIVEDPESGLNTRIIRYLTYRKYFFPIRVYVNRVDGYIYGSGTQYKGEFTWDFLSNPFDEIQTMFSYVSKNSPLQNALFNGIYSHLSPGIPDLTEGVSSDQYQSDLYPKLQCRDE